ncbi:guanine nucleotide-binding protein G(I)/G(S)/G(O) subunit gamma-5 [Platysternon megacephalum]|uniref:Guanine nucleotide-binding protein G(I)/G(S)/G(O) subunit gamma-5 n=1 Tax=Platysternon megacephalum TaxID=55544 RepID=A0A4D9EWZ6_9SAUR|nr:guanine nucleotide-binding protein G(I)/G(S)/G(O) subunit gamma-5 [Platysternon megacephalum]
MAGPRGTVPCNAEAGLGLSQTGDASLRPAGSGSLAGPEMRSRGEARCDSGQHRDGAGAGPGGPTRETRSRRWGARRQAGVERMRIASSARRSPDRPVLQCPTMPRVLPPGPAMPCGAGLG